MSQNDPMSYTQSVLGVNKKFGWKTNQNVTQAIIKLKSWSINAQKFTSTFPKKMRDIKMNKHVTWNIIWVEYLQPGSTSCWDILHTQQIFTSEKKRTWIVFCVSLSFILISHNLCFFWVGVNRWAKISSKSQKRSGCYSLLYFSLFFIKPTAPSKLTKNKG